MRGLTIIELLVAMAVATVVALALINILIQNNGLFLKQSARINQGLSINTISEQINSDIRQASAVAASYPPSSPQYITSLNTVVLSLPAADSSGNIINGVYDYLVITKDAQSPQILKSLTFPDPASNRKSENRVLTTKLSLINFFFLDQNNNTVSPTSASKVSFVVNQLEKAGVNNEQSSSSGQISLRNN